ncbi:11472_t:CDS:2, partial [Gigaspora margarita]
MMNAKKRKSKDLTDPNTISNSDTNPEDNNTSSDKSLSGDNINTDLNSITDHSNETSNTDHSNKNSAKTKLRKNSSWVWQYFCRRHPSQKWKTRENCTVIVKSKKAPNGQQECGQLVKTQGSTGNFQTHLNAHGITKPTKAIEIIAQLTITEMFHHAAGQNTHQKESINRALVKWIVTNLQPLYVLKSDSFVKFIHTLNPYYKLPSDKHIKLLIHQNYNNSTAHSRSGYIGISCFINSNYELKEVILAIKYVPYSHDAISIKAKLEKKWLLQIKHAIKLMEATINADNDYNI